MNKDSYMYDKINKEKRKNHNKASSRPKFMGGKSLCGDKALSFPFFSYIFILY